MRKQYSGVGSDAPLPMLLSMRSGAIDRGACIKDFSQYPGEVHPIRWFQRTVSYV